MDEIGKGADLWLKWENVERLTLSKVGAYEALTSAEVQC